MRFPVTDETSNQCGIYQEGSPNRWEHSKDFTRVRDRDSTEEFVVCGYIFHRKICGMPDLEAEDLLQISLILGKYRDGGVVYKGLVTSKVNHKAMLRLKKGECPFLIYPASCGKAVWCIPAHVCIIEYASRTKRSLHNAIFKGFRDEIYGWETLNTE